MYNLHVIYILEHVSAAVNFWSQFLYVDKYLSKIIRTICQSIAIWLHFITQWWCVFVCSLNSWHSRGWNVRSWVDHTLRTGHNQKNMLWFVAPHCMLTPSWTSSMSSMPTHCYRYMEFKQQGGWNNNIMILTFKCVCCFYHFC